jgi:exosome complex component RRP4
MSKLLVEERNLVIPGQEVATGIDYLPSVGTARMGENIIATRVGLLTLKGRVLKVIPLRGKYIPKVGDTVIGRISDVGMSGWRVNIGWAFVASLRLAEASERFIPRDADLTNYFDVGEYVACKITRTTVSRYIDVTAKGPGLRKLDTGRIIKCDSSKVPRIIGKKGSMISMLKEASDCRIMVGQNGIVWISGQDSDKELLVEKTIRLIEERSHERGLTDVVSKYLEDNK